MRERGLQFMGGRETWGVWEGKRARVYGRERFMGGKES